MNLFCVEFKKWQGVLQVAGSTDEKLQRVASKSQFTPEGQVRDKWKTKKNIK